MLQTQLFTDILGGNLWTLRKGGGNHWNSECDTKNKRSQVTSYCVNPRVQQKEGHKQVHISLCKKFNKNLFCDIFLAEEKKNDPKNTLERAKE